MPDFNSAHTAADFEAAVPLALTALQPGAAVAVPSVAVSASKTLALSDANTEQVVDAAGAVVLTIPTNAVVAHPLHTKIAVAGIGAGTVTITADTGVTINGVTGGSVMVSGQYGAVVMTMDAVDAWRINGDRGVVA